MHDSGKRHEFDTGAVRDSAEKKPRPDLISPYAQWRKGEWLRLGAIKYAERNWEKGMLFSRCVASIFRHLLEYMMGLKNEDHLAAIAVNAEFLMHYESMIKKGKLSAELDDMPHYEDASDIDIENDFFQGEKMLRHKITAYLSCPMRGFMGEKAPPEEIRCNCLKAIEASKKLWRYFGSNLKLYVPPIHNEALEIAMEKGYLNIDQVLDVDCGVVSRRDVILVYNWQNHISGGMRREIDTANRLGIPVRVFTDVQEADLEALKIWLEKI